MPFILGALAILAGIANTVQNGANASLNKALEAPVLTAFAVVAGNAVVYLAVGAAIGFAWPSADRWARVPWWGWTGGLLGAGYVLCVIFFAQKLGAAVFTGLSVTAAIVTSVVLDHFGWVGFAQHPAGLWRVLGCLLMIGGLALVSLF